MFSIPITLWRLTGVAGLAVMSCALHVLHAGTAYAAPYAAMVIDARTGQVLHARNADRRLHPASLTKMMTLYIAFEAVERDEIDLDALVRVSANAAAEECVCMGLKKGQRVRLRYLIRAAAVKSANDAATAIAEAIAGSEQAFIERMNRTAHALRMDKTTFRNANGLTRKGQLSTAHDMTRLGRALLYHYPEYYNLFSRPRVNVGTATLANTNRALLQNYKGADGIKTGYTRAAGSNLVASAKRDGMRVIATVFGAQSSRARTAKVSELLDMGFARATPGAAERPPERPLYAHKRSYPPRMRPAVLQNSREEAARAVDGVQTGGGVQTGIALSSARPPIPRPAIFGQVPHTVLVNAAVSETR